MDITLIVASTGNNGIGSCGTIPWHISEDLKKFKELTKGSVVIMGRKTFNSLPGLLPDRTMVLVSSKKHDQILTFPTLKEAINNFFLKKIFIIGGAEMYKEGLNYASKIYHTLVLEDYYCDVFWPGVPNTFSKKNIENVFFNDLKNVVAIQTLYEKKFENEEEQQYLNLVYDICRNGIYKKNRTEVDTFNLFSKSMTFSLKDDKFPLLTTKKMFTKGIIEELLFFINGSTNSKLLEEKGVNIWKGNTSKEFIKNRGLNYEEGDMGPLYGFQWRHSGANYIGYDHEYKGFDQLLYVVSEIKNNPGSRRILMNTWIPNDLNKMVLTPCHVLFQLFVRDQYLDSIMYQRSADMGLGVPFNIASYALLTKMLAHCTDLLPGNFTLMLGDAHVYKNHIEGLKEQLWRKPKKWPTLKIATDNKDITKFKNTDFVLTDYCPYDLIKLDFVI